MSFALILALVVSLGLHALALFGLDVDLEKQPEPVIIVAQLRSLPPTVSPVSQSSVEQKKSLAKHPATRLPSSRRTTPHPKTTGAPSTPIMMALDSADTLGSEGNTHTGNTQKETVATEESSAQIPESHDIVPAAAFRLPPRGMIRFRVDKGDANFEIGAAYQEWSFDSGRYRLHSVVETTGLVWLFRSVRIEMESLGRFSENGLQPEVFGVQSEGRRRKEKALFDWETMKVRVSDRPEQALDPGAQDLLSFYYQLGFLDFSNEEKSAMHIATGKKYGRYRLEVLGDEEIEVPMPPGTLRTRHLRAPGENATELWLAYDYLMLPVKIRHVDSKGNSLVQVVTEIKIGQ